MKIEEAILYWEGLRKTFSENMEKENNPFGKQHYQTSIEAIDTAITALHFMQEILAPVDCGLPIQSSMPETGGADGT